MRLYGRAVSPTLDANIERRLVDSLQQEFSMLERGDADLIRWCGDQGTGVVTYGPLAYGLLTGTITAATTFEPDDHRARPDSLFGPARRPGGVAGRCAGEPDRLKGAMPGRRRDLRGRADNVL